MHTDSDATVDVCIVLYRPDLELLARTLAPLKDLVQLRYLRIRLNGRIDAEPLLVLKDMVARTPKAVLSEGLNSGFAHGQNSLIAASLESGADYALCLNPDVALDDDGLMSMVEYSRKLGDLHLVSGWLRLGDRPTGAESGTIDTRGIEWTSTARHFDLGQGRPAPPSQGGTGRQRNGISGACMLVPRAAWTRIADTDGEFFDEEFFAYREDAELGVRALALGVGSFVLDRPVGTHWRGTVGFSRANSTTNFYGLRNRILLAARLGTTTRPGAFSLTACRDTAVLFAAFLRGPRDRRAITEGLSLWGVENAKRRRLLKRIAQPSLSAGSWRCGVQVRREDDGSPSDWFVVIPAHMPDARLIKSASELSKVAQVVVVSDGGEIPNLVDSLSVTVLWNPMNRGIARSLNDAISYCRERHARQVMTLDQDSYLDSELAVSLFRAVERSGFGAVGIERFGSMTHTPMRGRLATDGITEVREVLQSGAVFSVAALTEVGLHDESLFIDGVDTDISLRLRKAGWKVGVLQGSMIQHQLGAGDGRRFSIGPFRPTATGHSPSRRGYITRNGLRLLLRHGLFDPSWAVTYLRRLIMGGILAVSLGPRRSLQARSIVSGIHDSLLRRSGRMDL